MAAAVFCGPCRYREITKEAKKWCTNCDEGLCDDCAEVHKRSEISQNHEIIFVDDFRKIDNIKQCMENCKSATNEIKKLELEIKNDLLLTRTKVNDHLDKLQKKLLRELRSTSYLCTSKYNKLLQNLESREEMLTKLRKQTLHMKTNSSEKQLFFGTREINKKIAQEIESTKNVISTTKDYELKFILHSLIETFLNGVKEFGQIKVLECDTNLDFRDPKNPSCSNWDECSYFEKYFRLEGSAN
ncbi:unnamed protein product [Mytilus coruscus]|uniref:B box-type domain-containing protein n=1 Tax=Mytilus coruscus TaxID=42192 RepID=A0A6J8DK39_MYTCO|nr:unnamed protein product [Mytilus coruscus]